MDRLTQTQWQVERAALARLVDEYLSLKAAAENSSGDVTALAELASRIREKKRTLAKNNPWAYWWPSVRCALILSTMAIAVLFVLLAAKAILSPKVWRASYFQNLHHQGEPVVVEESRVEHFWTSAPYPEVPVQNFSAIWSSCLKIPSSMWLGFALASDADARFFIDDKLMIDNHQTSPEHRERRIGLVLPPGNHSLRVEYAHRSGRVKIVLRSSDLQGRSWSSLYVLPRSPDDACR